jgi:hypothetical protein
MKAYYVLRNGMYLVETTEHGVYGVSKSRNDAMEFSTLDELRQYTEDECKLNIANIAVEEIELIEQRNVLKCHNGVWYNHDTHYVCSRCGKIDSRFNENVVDTINGEESLCFTCLESLDDSDETWSVK